MKLTDKEKKEMEIDLARYGFKKYDTAFFDGDEYRKLRAVILDGLPNYEDSRLKFNFCNIDKVLNAGKEVVEKHTDGIDTRVLYSRGDYFSTYLTEKFGSEIKKEQYNEVIEFIKNNAELIKVTDIPVSFNNNDDAAGYTSSVFFYRIDEVDLEFYKMVPVTNHKIILEGPCTDKLKFIYVHEMYHALLERNKGTVGNYFHDEMLSIFMEKVAALDLDASEELLEKKILERLLSMKRSIINKTRLDFLDENHLNNFTAQKYIISTLCATDLFNTYKKGSNKLKKEIDGEINKVLVGNGTIEDVMDRYEVTPEKGSQLVKRQVKNFSK